MDQNILVFNFPTNATLEHSAVLLNDLKSALKSKKSLQLNLKEIETIDLSAIQLLLSLFKTAVAQKRELRLLDPIPSAVFEALRMTGFVVNPDHGAQGLMDAIKHYQLEGVL